MESNYDEDLSENIFFRILKAEHEELFEKSVQEGWIICIPRLGSLPKYALTYEDFFSHILIPSYELPETHFRTLDDKEIRICNRTISIEADDVNSTSSFSTQILFEETYYTDEMLKYKVLCIDSPLDINLENTNDHSISNIQTLRDCIDLLWTESKGKEIFEKIDEAIKIFLITNENLEYSCFEKLKILTNKLYINCLNICLKDNKLRQSINFNKYLIDSIKIAVETYVHHGIYKVLIKGINACTAVEDSNFNKMIRNLSDIQLQDLDIREDLYDTVPRARSELSRIECYSTILGKIGCVRRCISAISKEDCRDKLQGNIITVDDLLPMIIFLVVKCALPNWIAHLTFMKHFHFSQSSELCTDQDSFLITSLEASIEHIKSGLLIGSPEPEALMSYEEQDTQNVKFKPSVEMSDLSTQLKVYNKYNNYKKISSLTKLFENARIGNVSKVKQILLEENLSEDCENIPLCHPLCSCDDCEEAILIKQSQSKPTILSTDERGFTVLHVASLYGRINVVEMLIEMEADPNKQDFCGCSPLHYAATRGHQNVLLFLLHSKASINLTDSEGNTPLHLSTNNGHETCVKALIYFNEQELLNMDINATNNMGDTPLHYAARWGYATIIQLLLDHGANAMIENKRKITPLQNSNNLHVAKLLYTSINKPKTQYNILVPREKPNYHTETNTQYLDYSDIGNKNNTKQAEGTRPKNINEIKKVEKLFELIENNEIGFIKKYFGIVDETQVEAQDQLDSKSSCHPLCQCIKCKCQTEEIQLNNLTDKLDINICNSDGFTALHIATALGHYDLVEMLIKNNANVNITTRVKNLTPLHIACQNNNSSIVKLLLNNNCIVNTQDYRGNTPLHYAVINNNINLVQYLLNNYNANSNIKNNSGLNCLDLAQQITSLSIIRLLSREKPIMLV